MSETFKVNTYQEGEYDFTEEGNLNNSKKKNKVSKKIKDDIFIHIGTFFSVDTAIFLKKRRNF